MSTLYGSDAMGGVINIITRKVGKTWGGSITVGRLTRKKSPLLAIPTAASSTSAARLSKMLLGLALRGSNAQPRVRRHHLL